MAETEYTDFGWPFRAEEDPPSRPEPRPTIYRGDPDIPLPDDAQDTDIDERGDNHRSVREARDADHA